MKSIIKKLSALILTLATILSVVTISAVPASAASANINSNVKGISLKVSNTTVYDGGKITITPILNTNAKNITTKITGTIAGKTFFLQPNKAYTISLPKNNRINVQTLSVTFKFNIKVQQQNSPQKWVYQTTVSSKIYEIANINSVITKAKKTYKEGSKLHYIKKYAAYQCHGFACYMSDLTFGSGKPTTSNKSYKYIYSTANSGKASQIRPGDMVRYRNGSYDHTIFVTKVDRTYVYYSDCNGDGRETVRYNQKIKKTTLEKQLKQKLIDPISSKYVRGYIAHHKNNYL